MDLETIKCCKGKLIIQFENGKALQDKIKFEGGLELDIWAEERPEFWANCIAKVIYSAVEGISKGDIVGASYQSVFDYELHNDGTRTYKNQIEKGVFVVDASMIMFIRGEEDVAFGNYVMFKDIEEDDKWKSSLSKMKKGIGAHHSGLEGVPKGADVYFEDKYKGEKYEGYRIMNKDFIFAAKI